jgi:chromosome segregation ATPase
LQFALCGCVIKLKNMSFIKQLLSPFVEFEEDKKEQPVKETKSTVEYNNNAPVEDNVDHPLITASGVTSTTPAPTSTQRQTISAPGGLTNALPEHQQYFEKLIEEANAKNPLFQGTDFKEFIDSKTDIDNITDEETKYKTAFNVLKRTGLTKEKLVSTAHEYHNLIGRDLNAFQSAHSQQYQKEVKQREQLIQKKAEELQALSVKINSLKQEISKLSQEMSETKDKLNLTKNSFLLAGEKKQVEIQNELQKIEKYF